MVIYYKIKGVAVNIERKLKQDTLDIYKALIDWMENCPYDIGEEISDE